MMQRNLVDLLHNRFKRNISIRSLNISPMAQRLRSGSRWCSKASDNCLSHHRRKRDINVVEAVWFINPPSIAWGLEPGFPMTTCDTLDNFPLYDKIDFIFKNDTQTLHTILQHAPSWHKDLRTKMLARLQPGTIPCHDKVVTETVTKTRTTRVPSVCQSENLDINYDLEYAN